MREPTRTRRAHRIAAVLLVAALTVLTACGAAPVNTATIEQATAQLQQYFEAALDEITTAGGDATLEPLGPPIIGQCGPPHGTAPRGQEFANNGYFLRGFPADRNPEVYAAVERFWATNGWTIYDDGRPANNSVYARSRDKYEMVIRTSSDGSEILSLAGNSPCVWPDGTPPE